MKKIVSIVMTLVFLLSFHFADESASVRAHYAHPKTGVVEDSGNNLALGQSMVDNMVDPYAYFEEQEGQQYITLRFNLADQLGSVEFYVQEGESDFKRVDYIETVIGDDIHEYKLITDIENPIIRVVADVIPMGRDVIFFIDFKDFFEGNTDFLTLSDVDSDNITSVGVDVVGFNTREENLSTDDIGFDHGLLLSSSKELENYFLNKVSSESKNNDESVEIRPWGTVTKAVFYAFIFLLFLFTLILAFYAYKIYSLSIYLEKSNDKLESSLYE